MSTATRVLVVDDDPPTCELIRDVLGQAEVEVMGVTNSTTAALRLQEQHFDAVFLDAWMPPPDGIDLARQMRSSILNKKSLIVMITGCQQQNILRRAFDAGVNFLVFKPIDRHALVRLIRVAQGAIDHEKRRHTRVTACCEVAAEFGQRRAQGKSVDLSVSGMLVRMDRQFPVGSRIRLKVNLDPNEPLACTARVVRLVAQDSMGVEFEDTEPSDKERLQDFLAPYILQSAGARGGFPS